ncbi:Heat shock 70 kDa protein 5 [Bienertia sinuspersici]
MLLAVEGGGFFSSSASGYSKGLTLLLLGQRSDEKHMRVAPWNQYQLVDQETESDLQLASGKNRLSRGCATFVCFGRASAGLDGQSPLKVGPTQPQDILPSGPLSERDKEQSIVVEDDNNARNITLKSSLKKPSHNIEQTIKKGDEQQPLAEEGSDLPGHAEKRKVQWTDACGKELAEIREFELSGFYVISRYLNIPQ